MTFCWKFVQFKTISSNLVRRFCTHFNSYAWRTHTCGELNARHCGKVVTLCGWISYHRCNRFIVLRDSYGCVQVIFSEKDTINVLDTHNVFENLPLESVIQVTGTVLKRPSKDVNKRMQTGEIEVEATDVKLLNECSSKSGISAKNVDKVSDVLKLKYRYLSLRSAKLQKNLRLRSTMLMRMREHLIYEHGFVDVETPTLFKRTPGGAREFIVPTKFPGHFYCLTQSPQQFKQMLMVGGVDRYFQVARCYRNEGTKSDRQPEFTQLDIELSFTTVEHVKSLVESLLHSSWPAEKAKIQIPFPTMTYKDAIELYGTDKPDLRYHFAIQDLSIDLKEFAARWSKKVGKYPESLYALVIPSGKKLLRKSFLQDLYAEAEVQAVKCFPISIKENLSWTSSLSKLFEEKDQILLSSRQNLKKDDILFLALGKKHSTLYFLGQSRRKIAEYLESVGTNLINKEEFAFVWITDFPLFVENADGCLEPAHHPFTAPVPSDKDKIYSEPSKVLGQHYDLVLNGQEIGGGSIRIHDSDLQRYVIEQVLKEEVMEVEHLLDALKSGCPPHGGIALGIDRLVAILCDCASIAQVMAFPKSLDGKDLLSGAPSPISMEDQKLYHIKPVL